MKPLRHDAPNQIYERLLECLGTFKEVVIPITGDDFDAQTYHDNLESTLKTLKQLSIQIMDSGRMVGFRQLSVLHDLLEEAEKNERSTEANEIFWSLLSDYFPVEKNYVVSHEGLSNPLRIKLFAQMVEQTEDAGRLALKELSKLPDDLFMEGLTTTLMLVQPPERPFCTSNYELLYDLKMKLKDSAFSFAAAEHVAAHQTLYLPFFEYLLDLVTNPPALKSQGTQEGSTDEKSVDCIIDEQKSLLVRMGYLEEKISEVIKKNGTYGSHIARVELESISLALALPPEFLLSLHQLTEAPVVRQMAEISCEKSSGNHPYWFLEQMGIARTPEWHLKAQETSILAHAIGLYEHAILTPGIELSLDDTKTKLHRSSVQNIKDLITMLESIPTSEPECRRKGQELFDVLVANMGDMRLLAEQLQSCKINRAFYAKHTALKGRRLEDELGM